MFKDVELSRDVMASFRESPQARSMASDVELSVHVLTQGYWPTYPPVEVSLPQEVLKLQEIFSTYYTTKHNGRRLQWHPYLGHCTLKANFPQGKKELVVSLLQAIVLLLFNEDESISYHDILAATAIDDKELKVTLQSLACGKQRVLRKEPKGRDVAEDDVFFFDITFKTPVKRPASMAAWRRPSCSREIHGVRGVRLVCATAVSRQDQFDPVARNGAGERADHRASVPGPLLSDRRCAAPWPRC